MSVARATIHLIALEAPPPPRNISLKGVSVSMSLDQPRVVDLFSGCGGLSLGFMRAGFDVIAGFDSWQPAVETYNRNFPHAVQLAELDLHTELPDADVIVGGPPCQGFSSAGRRNVDDQRNSLIRVFATLVAQHRPSAFVFENVEGFLTQGHGRFVFDLLEPLVDAGYRIHLRKVNAAHYGVPQHRKRVVAIGGLGWDPQFPSHTHSAIGAPGAHLANEENLPCAPTVAEALAGLSSAQLRCNGEIDWFDHTFAPFNEADQNRAALLGPGQRMRDLPEELWHDSYRKRAFRRVMDGTPSDRRGGAPAGLRRLSSNEPSKAITGGAMRDFVHPSENRPLTVRECARLQTFPDDFVFSGTLGDKIQMIGNAVPVRFAEAVAMSVMADLSDRRPSSRGGQLLSFVPTLSSGMSPALRAVCRQVDVQFMSDYQGGCLVR